MDMREARDVVAASARYWWIFLITGTAWLLFSIILLRFDYTSVTSLSVLFGCAMIAAACAELLATVAASGWARLGHGALAAVCVVVGVVAFVHPGNTFRALAAILSFYLVVDGALRIVLALADRTVDLWWLGLVAGLVEAAIGFWAAGYWGRSQALLLAWIGITALIRGVGELVFAFRLRGVNA